MDSPFGINAWVASRFYTEAQRERAMQLLRAAGAAWTREEFCWACMEWSPQASEHVYHWQLDDWFDFDNLTRLSREQPINILGLLDYGPGADVRTGRTYRRQSCPSDANAAPIDAWLPAWREFVGAVVARYHERIKTWEVQNEPTSLCFWRKVDLSATQPSAADYVTVLRAASEVIRQTDPEARVVLGGLSPEVNTSGVDYFQFLAQVHEAGGWPDFDIVALHPYRTPFAPEDVLSRSRFDVESLQMESSGHRYSLQDELEAFQRLIARWGAKPIWLTEIGWASNSLQERAQQRGTLAEVVQADYLIRSTVQALAAGVQVVMWYDLREDAVPSPEESSFGLIRRDFSPKPAYDAFGSMAHALAGSQFQGQALLAESDAYEYRFVNGSQRVLVLWYAPEQDGPRTIHVEHVNAERARLIGPELGPYTPGAGTIVTPVNGTLDLRLSERPVFVLYDEDSFESEPPVAGPNRASARSVESAPTENALGLENACGLALAPLLLAACGVVLARRRTL